MQFWQRFWKAFSNHWEGKLAVTLLTPLGAFVVNKWAVHAVRPEQSLLAALYVLLFVVTGTCLFYLIRTPFLLHKESVVTRARTLGNEIKRFILALPPKPDNRVQQIQWVTDFHERYTRDFKERVRKIRDELGMMGAIDNRFDKDVMHESLTLEEMKRIADTLLTLSIEAKIIMYRKKLQSRYIGG